MPKFKIDPLLALAHTIASAPGTQAILIGSGISRSAMVPTGWEVTIDLIERVAALSGRNVDGDPEGWFTNTYGEPANYSALLAALAHTPAERRALLQSYFEPNDEERAAGAKLPTLAHRAIARLVVKGFIKVIVTTNFDRLMESALRDEGIEPTIVATLDAVRGATPLVHQTCVVLKVHGDYLDNRMRNTEVELSQFDSEMDAYIDRIFDEFGLIVCGWSAEWDFALRCALERCRSHRYLTTWSYISEPTEQARRLIELRQAKSVHIISADKFFSDLVDKVESIASLSTLHPLSAATAVASIKRFIPDERYRIQLEDFVLDEISRTKEVLAGDFPCSGGPQPNNAIVAERIRRYDSSVEVLRHMVFEGCRLARGSQSQLFLKAMTQLVQNENVGGWSIWIEMRRYPISLLLYSGALGALVSENWLLLRQILYFRWRTSNLEKNSSKDFCIVRAIGSAAHALYAPQRRHTPASDHLQELLAPLSAPHCGDAAELFDQLETWFALAYIDQFYPADVGWMPAGRYCWRQNYSEGRGLKNLLADAESAGADWAPIRSGWFLGQAPVWATVREHFTANLIKMSHSMW